MTDSLFPLDVFPPGLSHSLHTPVLVGVLILAAATETFGTSFSGLLVPGYVAPIFLLKPLVGCVIALEAILTYLLVRGLSEGGCRLGLWSSFFGRDRFVAIVLAGTLIRTLLEGYLFPAMIELGGDLVPAGLELEGNLLSMGLLVVPLMANALWKTGLTGGLASVFLPLGATYLVLRHVLMPHTNFSVGRLELAYDSIAIDLLANPKVYVLMLVTMLIAARASLRYGWDLGGVMVPALVSLVWFEPSKLISTCLESWIVYRIARVVLGWRIFANTTIEGPRKILSAFLIGYAVKYSECTIARELLPAYNPIDLFGLGYLLPSLLACKMIQHASAAQVLGPLLSVSALGALWGNAVGFALVLAVPLGDASRVPAPAVFDQADAPADDLRLRLLFDRRLILSREAINAYHAPAEREREAFASLFARAAAGESGIAGQAAAVGFAVASVRDGKRTRPLLYFSEAPAPGVSPRGHGIFVFRHGGRPLAIEVVHPLADEHAVRIAAWLFDALEASALLVAGAHPATNVDGSADARLNRATALHSAHRALAGRGFLSVRQAPASMLQVVRELPCGLDLSRLKDLVGPLPLAWERLERAGPLAEAAAAGFAELMLDSGAVRRLRAAISGDSPLRVEAELIRELVSAPEVRPLSRRRTRTSTAWLQYADHELLAPLARLVSSPGEPDPLLLRELAAAADSLDWELVRWPEPLGSGPAAVALREKAPGPGLLGTFVFRAGHASPVVVEVPEPVRELRAADFAVNLFFALRARALLVGAGTEPGCRDETPYLRVAHQVVSRESLSDAPELTLEVRGFPVRSHPSVKTPVVLTPLQAAGEGIDRFAGVKRQLEELGLQVALQDRSPELAPFAELASPLALYSLEYRAGLFAYLAVSDELRDVYASCLETADETRARLGHLDTLRVERRRGDLDSRLAEPILPGHAALQSIPALMEQYCRTQNPLVLAHVVKQLGSTGGRLEHFIDPAGATELFVVELPGSRSLYNPRPRDFGATRRTDRPGAAPAARLFLLRREFALVIEGGLQ